MALELTEEQKKEVDELIAKRAAEEADKKVKELGFDDHAKNVIARTNAEAKSHREAKENAEKAKSEVEAELKKYRDADAARKAEEDKRASEEAARKKAEEDEKKTVQQRLKEIEDASNKRLQELEEVFERKLTEREKKAIDEQKQYLDELKARDAQILQQAVLAEAKEHGIIDEALIKLLDLSEIKIEHGVPDRETITKVIEEHVAAKPHLYKKPEDTTTTTARDEGGRFARQTERPTPNKGGKGDVDWSKLSADEFDAMESRLRTGKV